jgi:hypothetical protein
MRPPAPRLPIPSRPAPAAQAILRWFTTDHSLGCFDQRKRESACAVEFNAAGFEVYYGDSTSDGLQGDVLAFIYIIRKILRAAGMGHIWLSPIFIAMAATIAS